MNNIREHLCRLGREISQRPVEVLPPSPQWADYRSRIRAQYLDMMGLAGLPGPEHRPSLNVKVAGVIERDDFRIEKILYESLPRLYVTANLYVPKRLNGPAPAVLYACGHSPAQKSRFQNHARRWAELGFVCLIYDTIQYGEIRGYHHGTYRWGWFHWQSKGYTPAGVECFNGIRGIDLLASRAEVDAGRIGVTGISGGGGASWWIAAADERVRAAAPVCGTGTVERHMRDKTMDEHCDCMFFPNMHGLDLHHVGALVAPRPLMIASADRDALYSIESVRDVHRRLVPVYAGLGAGENLQLVETPGAHSYHRISRTRIFSFFLKHLAAKDVPAERIADVGDYDQPETAADLAVLPGGPPAYEMSSNVQDWFVPMAVPPRIETKEDLAAARDAAVARLRETTFARFPDSPGPVKLLLLYEGQQNGYLQRHYLFDSEEDWQLSLTVSVPDGHAGPGPIQVSLRSPGEGRSGFAGLKAEERLGADRGKRLRAIIEPRNTGDTAWGDGMNWHVRRCAALVGRSVASMQVWDVLGALKAVRSLPEVDPAAVTLLADGDMTPVALLAGLLDGKLRRIMLDHAVPTFNVPSADGKSNVIEMLGVLRVLDLPVAAGLLWPAELVFVHGRPEAYAWAEDLYARLGPPGAVVRAKEINRWTGRQ